MYAYEHTRAHMRTQKEGITHETLEEHMDILHKHQYLCNTSDLSQSSLYHPEERELVCKS